MCYICRGAGCNRCGMYDEGSIGEAFRTRPCLSCGAKMDPSLRECPHCGHAYLAPGERTQPKSPEHLKKSEE